MAFAIASARAAIASRHVVERAVRFDVPEGHPLGTRIAASAPICAITCVLDLARVPL